MFQFIIFKIIKMKRITIVLFFLFFVAFLSAQTVVKGSVMAADTKEPLKGCSIKIRGTTISVSTGAEGHYELKIPANMGKSVVLMVSYAGFNTQTSTLIMDNGQSYLKDFELQEASMLGKNSASDKKKRKVRNKSQ